MQILPDIPAPKRFALARDRRHWDGARTALSVSRDGWLQLASIPGPAGGVPIDRPGPYAIAPSGIATGPCGVVFVADTARHRLVVFDPRCGTRAHVGHGPGIAPGEFHAPRGLALAREGLWIADSGNRRVQQLARPGLEPSWSMLSASLAIDQPVSVAVDSVNRIYVVDGATPKLTRFTTSAVDAAYNAIVAGAGAMVTPTFVAIGVEDGVLVADPGAQAVLLFDSNGLALGRLPAPAGAWQPGAIATYENRIFVHDRLTGIIHVFENTTTYATQVSGWRGPVSALAVDEAGALLIKPGLDDEYVIFDADIAYAAQGSLEIGPIDAGEGLEWYRAAVDADSPVGTSVTLDVAQLASETPPPAPNEYRRLVTDAVLLALMTVTPVPSTRRWLWMRVTLTTADTRQTPTLRQVRAETPGEQYLDYLPAVYRREDTGALERLLSLIQTEHMGIEEAIDDIARVFTPDFAQTSTLPWLADWLGFELPTAADDDEQRRLLLQAMAWHARRGTPASLQSFVELHTGVRPAIVEGFTVRHMWVLGVSSQLGFDTALGPASAEGVVVADGAAISCEECGPTPRGSFVVGESGPLPPDRFGEPLFSELAHRFDVVVPRHRIADARLLDEIRRVLDREKPAHTQYCLSIVDPEIAVGFQSRVGVDTIVGGPLPGLRLDAQRLGFSVLAAAKGDDASRLGMNAGVGQTLLT